ncbi:MAG TPA: HhH-GPD-type base excision DNA repair protein [Dehalococcoidia bacterium]|nr:HhH-GPD-type base excision DNA repair protein [Dehalococcoidia bacterium]
MGDPEKYRELEPEFDAKGTPIPPFTNNPEANTLTGKDLNAFLIGLVLDQQIAMQKAFSGPLELKKRLGHLSVKKIAAMPQDEFISVVATKPAIHRFPGSMGKRVHDACQVVVDDFGGKAENIWKNEPDANATMKRFNTVPGIGKTKQKLAMLLLARYYNIELPGWEEASPIDL